MQELEDVKKMGRFMFSSLARVFYKYAYILCGIYMEDFAS